jgi:small subunit ribosomal protein S1
MAASAPAAAEKKSDAGVDLSSLTSMLSARWKGGAAGTAPEALGVGEIRSFRIVKLDRETEKIELELA